jgi:DNA-binding transcriptional ArsR family regulator
MNHMVQYESPSLDSAFAALADATRRGVVLQLGMAEASISDLAARFDMTLTGMKKHVGVLEAAGFVTTEKVGRVRKCRLGPRRMEEEAAWIAQYRKMWDARFNALDGLLDTIKARETSDDRGN